MKKTRASSNGNPEPAEARECRVAHNVKVPMRDGVELSASIYLPLKPGRYPVVLVRTAYNRTGIYDPFFLQHGMGLVTQDCRGRYDSDGLHEPFINEKEDGFDTLEWIARQPCCNGRIGMIGASYLAATQFSSAISGSRHLKALNPQFMAGDCWKRAYYCDGAFSLALTWSWLCFETAHRTSKASLMPLLDVPSLLRKLPIISLDEAGGAGVVPAYREYVKRSAYDSYWKTLSIRHSYGRFRMPVLLTGGWYDNYAAENATNFLGLRQNAPTTKLRDSHRMLIGPWSHGILSTSVLGERDFGPKATGENDAGNRWLDTILHGKAPSEFQKAPIRIFVMGLNRWRDEYEWPLRRTRYVNYYLQPGGRLALDPPAGGKPDRYVYDPENPVPTLGGNHSVGPYNPGLYEHAKPGPYDQRPIEKRRDVLSYTSEALKRDTEVTGPVALKLFASSSARDTDFVAKLTDVHPDGRSINITEGVIRARFRENVWGKPRLLIPHRVYEFTIDMLVTSNVFRKGHRLRVDIMSSNFPLWDRNLNTGNDPGTDATVNTAEQAIHHDKEHPSCIVLPVIPAC